MMGDEGGLSSDDFAEAFGDGQDLEHKLEITKLKTKFEPWHHPRKQYVRIEQWCRSVRNLIPELNLGVGDPFRYLTLPGNELLDVRALHGVCQRAQVSLRYLGFNSVGVNTAAQTELSLSQSEVRALSNIDELSDVLEDRLESVTNRKSPAFVRARSSGPFHAINIDLCDSIAFREINGRRGSPLQALARLMELQLSSTAPWLLFITTKAEPGLVGEFARDGFTRALNANIAASEAFREALAALIQGSIEKIDEGIASAWSGQDDRFLRLFCTGLGKWLLGLMSAASPSRSLSLVSSCYYQSGPSGPDMLSLAFRCDTPAQPLKDRFLILPLTENASELSEIESALELATSVGTMIDLDRRMLDDSALSERLITQSARLLASARYGEAEYADWARARLSGSPAAINSHSITV